MFALTLGESAAWAATIVADGVQCTLADAIRAANTNTITAGCSAGNDSDKGGDGIELTADVALTAIDNYGSGGCANGLPPITSTIWIEGNRHSIVRAFGPFDGPEFRVLDSATGNLTLRRVTVSNGYLTACADGGGGAGIAGTVTLIESTISHNGFYVGDGGGISGNATLFDSKVFGNYTQFGNGGGIHGTSRIFNSTVSDNCVRCQPPSLTFFSLAEAELEAPPGEGGGIYGAVTLVDSVVSGNSVRWEIRGGGGITIDGTGLIVNSTISNNSGAAVGGGIHLYRGTLTLINSTVSNNELRGMLTDVSGDGAGIYSSSRRAESFDVGPGGPVTLIHSTVSSNRSVGRMAVYGLPSIGIAGDAITLVDSIIADNTLIHDTAVNSDCVGESVVFKGVSLVGDASCGAAAAGQLTDDAMLAPLADYGGRTPIHLPLPGSPVINRIKFAVDSPCRDVLTDQRGVTRPYAGRCDIGSVEYTGFPLNPVLDNFNRDDGPLGTSWVGNVEPAAYRIRNDQVSVGNGGAIAWETAFGPTQEAYITLSDIDRNGGQPTLLLKVQSSTGAIAAGAIAVLYDPSQRVVRIATWLPDRGSWDTYGTIPIALQNGDQLGGRVSSLGQVEVYRNNVLVDTFALKARDQRFFNSKGGRIGLLFGPAFQTTFDSSGGGTILP